MNVSLEPRHFAWATVALVDVVAVHRVVHAPSVGATVVAAVTTLVIIVGCVVQHRRDPVWFAQFVTVLAGFASLTFLVAVERPGTRALMLALFGTSFLVALKAAQRGWGRPWPGRRHNLLLDWFAPNRIFETSQVQYVVRLDGLPDGAQPGALSVFMQSCVGARRRVLVSTEAISTGFWQPRTPLQIAVPRSFELGPGEVGRLVIPFGWGEARPGVIWLYVEVAASGPGGIRLQAFRGPTVNSRPTTALQLASVATGYGLQEGGVAVELHVPEDGRVRLTPPPEAWWETIAR